LKYFQQSNLVRRGVISISVVMVSSALMTLPSIGVIFRTYVNGLNKVQIGMTVEQASQAAGVRFTLDEDVYHNSCRYASPRQGLHHVSLMLINGLVARIDINQGSDIRTLRGAGIGDSEDRIKSLYPDRIQVSPHEYTNGHYLTFIPKSSTHQAYRLVFETDGRQVVNYRIGKLPEVGYAEGCS
jgi:hypothetical protein